MKGSTSCARSAIPVGNEPPAELGELRRSIVAGDCPVLLDADEVAAHRAGGYYRDEPASVRGLLRGPRRHPGQGRATLGHPGGTSNQVRHGAAMSGPRLYGPSKHEKEQRRQQKRETKARGWPSDAPK